MTTMQDNPYAKMPRQMAVTAEAARFVETVQFENILCARWFGIDCFRLR